MMPKLPAKPLLLTITFALLGGCSTLPDVYLIDHHTVMEEEASGDWPQLEQRFRDLAVTPGPVALEKENNSRRRDRALNVQNGEMTNSKSGS
ncbi:MAG: hypothetical protein HQL49_11260 [Gammaproteobacteria bacterium]|nr:hypothetical protein [Gammaproteobacteria bacterium]